MTVPPSPAHVKNGSFVVAKFFIGKTVSDVNFLIERRVFKLIERIESISSPKNSTRNGVGSLSGKMSTSPPLTANFPIESTSSARS